MDPAIADKLRGEFPDGETWGWDSMLAGHSIFWNAQHRPLTELSDRQILIALIWRDHFAKQCAEAAAKFYFDEKKLWERHFGSGV